MSKQNILCAVLMSLNVVTWLMGASLCDLDSVSCVHKCSGCFRITCLALHSIEYVCQTPNVAGCV